MLPGCCVRVSDALYTMICIGDDADEFTIELHHGGLFVGFGHLRNICR